MSEPTPPTVCRMPANACGRDFILGDLHGHRASLDTLLAHARFDFQKDRLFFVGDFTDRGPDNVECLQLISEPWLFPVLGNHDFNLMLAGFLGDNADGGFPAGIAGLSGPDFTPPWDVWSFLHFYGGRWVGDLTSDGWCFLKDVAHQFQATPHVRIVGDGENRFHVVHAGLHPHELIIPETALSDRDLDAENWGVAGSESVLGLFTRRYNRESARCTNRLSLTYCGHSVVPRITRFAQHVNIDTGSGKGGSLSLLCHQTQEVWQIHTH